YDGQDHYMWCMVCDHPDADRPVFSEPRCLGRGFLRNKPVVLRDGSWLHCSYDMGSDRYCYSLSKDRGKSFEMHSAAVRLPSPFDETMAYQKQDGTIRMLARTSVGEIAACSSGDGGAHWSDAKLTGIVNPNSRFYIGRTPSGKLLLVNNDHAKERTNLTLYLSEDDGETWAFSRCIDTRGEVTYPDVDYHEGKIYLTYDRERYAAREVLLAVLTEDDIVHPENPVEIRVISASDAPPTPAADRDGKPYFPSQAEQTRVTR
ncbi:MAG: exo-alpha-sialidase, partial [Clostridia bacterium]|nr:exo-alpha-sialidase [Clostridia bacterium]